MKLESCCIQIDSILSNRAYSALIFSANHQKFATHHQLTAAVLKCTKMTSGFEELKIIVNIL